MGFFFFTVIPVAFRELLHWIYDWQILISGVLAIAAARYWGRSVIRAARITARAKPVSPLEVRKPAAEPVVVPASFAVAEREPAVRIPPARIPELAERLFSLREAIRTTLGRTPCTDDVLSEERIEDFRRIAEFPLGEMPSDASRLQFARFEALKSKLGALKDVRETDTCRNAWEALVRISIDARDLAGEETARARARALHAAPTELRVRLTKEADLARNRREPLALARAARRQVRFGIIDFAADARAFAGRTLPLLRVEREPAWVDLGDACAALHARAARRHEGLIGRRRRGWRARPDAKRAAAPEKRAVEVFERPRADTRLRVGRDVARIDRAEHRHL